MEMNNILMDISFKELFKMIKNNEVCINLMKKKNIMVLYQIIKKVD